MSREIYFKKNGTDILWFNCSEPICEYLGTPNNYDGDWVEYDPRDLDKAMIAALAEKDKVAKRIDTLKLALASKVDYEDLTDILNLIEEAQKCYDEIIFDYHTLQIMARIFDDDQWDETTDTYAKAKIEWMYSY